MKINLNNKSQKTRERIEIIQAEITAHRDNIDLLNEFSKGRKLVAENPYAPRVVKYNCMPRSEKNYQWSLQNIATQIQLLERELAVLIEYGA